MYVPAAFRVDDVAAQMDFIRHHSFATLITNDGEVPFASHLPVLIDDDEESLVAHMARANPQWQHFGDAEVLTIFQGPHAYVSPSWYETPLAVPTWNFTAVHVYGVPQIIEDHDRLCGLLQKTVDVFESTFAKPWPGQIPADFRDSLIPGIVGFEIAIRRIEAKFKLSQNRSTADQQNVRQQLGRGTERSRQLAAMMEVPSEPPATPAG